MDYIGSMSKQSRKKPTREPVFNWQVTEVDKATAKIMQIRMGIKTQEELFASAIAALAEKREKE